MVLGVGDGAGLVTGDKVMGFMETIADWSLENGPDLHVLGGHFGWIP